MVQFGHNFKIKIMIENLSKTEITKGNIEGELIEIKTFETIRVVSKEDLLAEKYSQLEEHEEGVRLYLAARELEKQVILEQIKNIEDAE
jgi:hypothetical protein